MGGLTASWPIRASDIQPIAKAVGTGIRMYSPVKNVCTMMKQNDLRRNLSFISESLYQFQMKWRILFGIGIKCSGEDIFAYSNCYLGTGPCLHLHGPQEHGAQPAAQKPSLVDLVYFNRSSGNGFHGSSL
jgi:hypothetical protein